MGGSGFIKIWRCIYDHPIWKQSSPEHKCILIALLGMANHEPNRWLWNGEEITVERGQFVTSISSIKDVCGNGISEQNVRSALKKFEEKFNFLTNKATKTGRLITIVNYDKWQGVESKANKETNKEVTKRQQRGNKEVTTNKNDKNDKNDKKGIYNAPDLSEFSQELRAAIQDWLMYKNERRENYTETGLRNWIGSIRNKRVVYEDRHLAEIIRESMARNYKGVIWDWLEKYPKKRKEQKPITVTEVTDPISAEEQDEKVRKMKARLNGSFNLPGGN